MTTVPMTPQVAQQTLIDLLPRKGIITNRAGGVGPGQALTELTFDDGHGAAGIDLAITYDTNTVDTGWACAGPSHTGTCSTLPDGSQLFVFQGFEYPDHRADTLDWAVGIRRVDGMQIEISEWNAPTAKGTPISRPAPPFTTAELTTVLTSAAWTANVSVATAQKYAGLFTAVDRFALPTGLPNDATPTTTTTR